MSVGISTGRRRDPVMPASAGFCGPGSTFPQANPQRSRSDIEVVFKDLPEPIDLEIDHATRILYWTDRGDPPNGNTVNRAPLDGILLRRTRNRGDPPDGRHWDRS